MTAQRYPFSKSRYFPHKRMRSADFIQDQGYVEGKLAFLSRLNFGAGMALGLEVQRIDADSLLVSPGFAVDRNGQWIIVDEPAICRIRTLPGFDALRGETALLWLTYHEELTDSMFVPGVRDEVREYASAKERFSFYLTNMRPLPQPFGDHALFSNVVLFEDDDLRIRQMVPRVLPADGMIQLRLVLEAFHPEAVELHLRYLPELPGLSVGEDGQPPVLERTLRLEQGETTLALTGRFSTTAQAVLLSLPEHGFLLEKRGVQLRAQCVFQEEFPVIAGDPISALRERLLSQDPRELWEEEPEEGVPISGVRMLRCGDQVLLDHVFPISTSCRTTLSYMEERLRFCKGFFPYTQTSERPASNISAPPPEPHSGMQRQMTTGVVTLTTGLHLQEGNLLCSEEIAHGLGPGTVYVEFGVENIYPAPDVNRNYTDLLLGDPSLFAQASGTYDHSFDRGVRVRPEKGTFELAVRIRGELHQPALRLRWFAWRAEESSDRAPQAGTLLRLEPDVAYTAPGGAIDFVPIFAQGTGTPCDFLVPERQSGTITPNGIYTAPRKDGLYQVCAQIKDMPETRVNAFVIVRTEDTDDGQDGL